MLVNDVRFGLVLWHINHFRLFDAKSSLYIYIYIYILHGTVCDAGFHAISNRQMKPRVTNSTIYIYIYIYIYKWSIIDIEG